MSNFSLVTACAFKLNGELPKYYSNPNVYDSACMAVVTCGTDMKYVPFCKQALNQDGDDSIKRFNELVDYYYSDFYKRS